MTEVPIPLCVVAAREESLAHINVLIARSKSYWDCPAEYLEKALPLHRLDTAYLRSNHCFEILNVNGELAAYASIAVASARITLDNLWVRPDLIDQGIGRRTCEHIFAFARTRGWTELWVLPDPPSEQFYKRMGFCDTGERVKSRVVNGPVFSVYSTQLAREID
jgi:N-acetylglutamate synthase-like GNAT family acetyltransferase